MARQINPDLVNQVKGSQPEAERTINPDLINRVKGVSEPAAEPRRSRLSEMLDEPVIEESPEVEKGRNPQLSANVASKMLEAKGVPQESFLKRFGKNLVEAPKKFVETTASIGSPFGGKQIGEAAQVTAIGAKGVLELNASKEIFNEQMQKIQADPNIPASKKQEARQILKEGLSNLEQDYKTKFTEDAPSKEQVMADIAEAGIDLATLGAGSKLKGLKMAGTQSLGAGSGAFSETGESEDFFIGATLSTAMQMLPKAARKDVINDVRKLAFDDSQKILADSAQVLQSGSKATALSKGGKFSNADKAFAKIVTESKKPINTFDDSVRLVNSKSKGLKQKVRNIINKKGADTPVGDSYLSRLRGAVQKMSQDPQMEDALSAYQKILEREEAFVKQKGGSLSLIDLQKRKEDLGALVSNLYKEGGGRVDLDPTQKATKQALDELRGGAKSTIEDVAGKEVGVLNQELGGLIDADGFLKIQRERAKNAIQEIDFKNKNWVDKLMTVKEYVPFIKDFGIDKFQKLDTKSDVLEALLEGKVKQMRATQKAVDELREKASKLKSPSTLKQTMLETGGLQTIATKEGAKATTLEQQEEIQTEPK